MQISVIGLGYMGLPMAAILARAGHTVVGVDINPATVAAVNAGVCPFSEPGMAELVREAHASGRLQAVAVPQVADAFVLSLPTPVDHATHRPDMTFVEAGSASIAKVLKAGDLVVLESTSPVGATVANCQAVIERLRPDVAGKVDYVFCPERAIPGNTLHEMVHNDRLVGGLTPAATARGVELYKSFTKGEVLPCTAAEAEMVKLVENASRDVQIAFANELSLACHQLGLDVRRVIALANHHPRVNILQPGTGVGGHCIAVDPWFIIDAAPDVTPLMKVARQVNDGKPFWVTKMIESKVEDAVLSLGKKDKVKVACLGLAYKPDVDDLRESPSITVVEKLAQNAALDLLVVEPHVQTWHTESGLGLVALKDALAQADVVVGLTAHKVFKELPAGALAGKVVVDACGVFYNRVDVTWDVSGFHGRGASL